MSIPANEVIQIRFRTVNGITIRYAESDGHQDRFIADQYAAIISAWVMGGYQNTGA